MKTLLILVGKTTDKHFQAGITDYVERIGGWNRNATLPAD